ncbi:hypothetical protein [Roseomonas indoligenes]|uniref:Uncharacterized protein n=1 Tax=Roseomonas indoligenes TaxID=2820811 RepID=A0A940S492_9PROT|nr:hypothetical protein [Pararoseomonas indoligenes]MBP0491744.1 hypothetical protein [Pararoseomonas indoligenes]
MLGQGIFGSRETALPGEVAVHLTEDDGRQLVGVVVPPGSHCELSQSGDLPSGPGLVQRAAALAINDGIRKAQALQAPLVIIDPFGVWDPAWGELRFH